MRQPTSTSTESPSADCLPTSVAVLRHEIHELPVQAGLEPGGEAGGDVGGEDRRAKSTVSIALVGDELCEHVDARLGQRRLETRVVGDVDGGGAVLGGLRGEAVDPRADDHGRRRRRRRAARAFASTPSEPFWSSLPWCSRKTRT